MMNASFTGSYDGDNSDATGSVVLNAGDVKLRASITGINTFVNKPSLNGLTLSVENPGSFTVNYDVPKKDVRFQFMDTIRVNRKPLNLTYTHSVLENRTALEGTLLLDCNHKVSAKYGFDSGDCKMKYSYVHGGVMTIEPQFDFVDNSWELAVSGKINDDSVVRASYQSSTSVLGLDLTKNSFANGGFKVLSCLRGILEIEVSASVNLADEKKIPRITAESIWDFEM